jgi:hypothetical protein
MGLKQLSGIVMDVDLTHPHDAVLLSLENNLTHTDQHRCSGFRFHGANTAISSEISLLIRQHDRRGERLVGKVFEFSDLPTPISPLPIF